MNLASKAGTGTVILEIEDDNDNIPIIPEKLIMCEEKGVELGSKVVLVEDGDLHPFSGPFSYSLPVDHDGTWDVERFNGWYLHFVFYWELEKQILWLCLCLLSIITQMEIC